MEENFQQKKKTIVEIVHRSNFVFEGESKKTKGHKHDRQNLLRSPMSEGGEQEN